MSHSIQPLTPRETEVLTLMAEGLGVKQTSARLGIAEKTVMKHRDSVAKRLRIRGIANLTRYAVAIGLVKNEYESQPS